MRELLFYTKQFDGRSVAILLVRASFLIYNISYKFL